MSDPPPAKKARSDHIGSSDNKVHLTPAETRTIKIQFEKDTSFPRFDDLLREYCRFLQMKVSHPINQNNDLAPSFLVDKLWHAHILSTREYLAFCEQYNQGKYLHHDPTMRKGQERYKDTLKTYESMFNEKPSDEAIWPKNVYDQPGIKEEGGEHPIEQEDDQSHIKQEGESNSNQNTQEEIGKSEEEKEEDSEEEDSCDMFDYDGFACG